MAEAKERGENGDGLPEGWVWTTIGAATLEVEKVNPADNPEQTFTYLDISSIDNSLNRITDPKTYLGKDAPSRARQLVFESDVLFSTVRTYLKNIALVTEQYDGQIASTGFSVLRGRDGVLGKYVFYYVLTDDFLEELGKLQRGVSYPAVRDGDVRAQPFPLPPLPEQRRIVEAIEAQFTRLDAGVAGLERLAASLKRYRAAVLKAACEGRLVPTEAALAAAEGRGYEDGERLLGRILAERRRRWAEENPGRKYKEPSAPDVEGLPALPEGWVWATVEQVAAHEPNSITDGPFGSKLKTAHYTEAGPRVIRLQNIGDGRFSDERAYISEEHFKSLSKHQVHAGDIVIAALGTDLPRSCIIPESVGPAIVKADCMRFKPNPKCGDVRYMNAALNSLTVRGIAAGIVHGIGRPRLNQQEVKSLPIPLPPLAEQTRIVAEVERRLSVIDALEGAVAANRARAGRLRQAILKRAFAGELV